MVINDKDVGEEGNVDAADSSDVPMKRNTVVVVGLGMVGLAFMCVVTTESLVIC